MAHSVPAAQYQPASMYFKTGGPVLFIARFLLHSLELFKTLSACKEYYRPDEEDHVYYDRKSYNCPTHNSSGMQMVCDVKKTGDGEWQIVKSKHGEREHNSAVQE